MNPIELDEDLFETVAAEFLARFRAGEHPSVDDYAARHPEIAAEVRELFPTIVAVERVKLQKEHSSDGRASMGARKLERLGDFRIIREIGRGGMGVVYEAEQESLGRHVAVKVLPPHALMDEVQVRRFQREAQTAARLHHTNIVPVFGVGQEEGLHYYVMQLIDGCGLDELNRSSRKGPIDVRRNVEMIRQVADAVQFAHDHGTLHRDIKPANILVDRQGNVWITDFGLARALETDETRTDHLGGTLRYMAPERFTGKTDASSDQYSLGITLYELVTGTRAYEGRSSGELFSLITQEPPKPARSINPAVPGDLETIIDKSIARDPSHRYPSVRAFEQDLERFLEGRPIQARRVTSPERLWRWCRRNPALAASLSAAAALLVLVAVMMGAGYVRTAQHNIDLSAALNSEKTSRQKEQQALASERTALDKERQARAQAESFANLALEAIDSVFERFAPSAAYTIALPSDDSTTETDEPDEPILLPPQSTVSPEVAAALEGLLPYYQRLAEETGQDAKVRNQVASARYKLGLIYRQLGRYDAALTELRTAQSLLAQADSPQTEPTRAEVLDLARASNDLGELERLNDNIRSAEEAHRKALSLLAPIPVNDLSDEERLELAETHYLLGRRELAYGAPGGFFAPPGGGGQRSGPDRGNRDRRNDGERRDGDGRPNSPPGDEPPRGFGPSPGAPREGDPSSTTEGDRQRRIVIRTEGEPFPPPPPDGERQSPPPGDRARPEGGRGPGPNDFFNRRNDERRQHLETAVSLLSYFPEQTRDTRVTLVLARCYRELSAMWGSRETRDQRRQEWERSIALLTGLVDKSPDVREFRFELSETYADIEPRFVQEDQLPEAEQRLRTALQLNQDLSSRASDAPAYAAARTQIRYKLASCLRRQGKDAEAESLLTAGIDAQRILARRNPDADTHVIWVGRLSRELADLLLDNAREGEALAALEKSAAETAAYLERAKTAGTPPNGFIVGSLSRTYRVLADVVRDQGDFARADAFDDQAREVERSIWGRGGPFPGGGQGPFPGGNR